MLRIIGGGVEREAAAVEVDLHGVLAIELQTLGNGLLCLLLGHAADIHARDIEVADDLAVVTQQKEGGENADDQNNCGNDAHEKHGFLAAGFLLLRLLRLFFKFAH